VDRNPALREDESEDDVARMLAPEAESRFPLLASLLAGPDGEALKRELGALFGPPLRSRAPRRVLRVMGRLRADGYDEPVLITDVSESGVRFLVQADVPLDLTRAGRMALRVRTERGPRELTVELVRRCGGDARHTDLACHFVDVEADHGSTVAELRSVIFGES